MIERQSIEELVYRSCLLLDEKNFSGFLDLCGPAFHYVISAYSPEIRKEMIWLEHDKPGIKLLFNNLPKHNSDQSTLARHATVYTVTREGEGDDSRARVVSALQVFKTTLDGGATELFAVGKLHDVISLGDDGPKLIDRNVRLETRMIGFGFHIPF